MHPNRALLNHLFTAEDRHLHVEMAACYHRDASFRDIAFRLDGIQRIHAMWHLISETDIRVTTERVEADDHEGLANIVCNYTFGADAAGKKGRPVRNVIQSRFSFKDGKIMQHHDFCDAKAWAKAALGGPLGFIAGRVGFVRWLTANAKLDAFVARHTEYRWGQTGAPLETKCDRDDRIAVRQ
jgi:ketosteroid isomerase-like protein